jgi:hypothetical protein
MRVLCRRPAHDCLEPPLRWSRRSEERARCGVCAPELLLAPTPAARPFSESGDSPDAHFYLRVFTQQDTELKRPTSPLDLAGKRKIITGCYQLIWSGFGGANNKAAGETLLRINRRRNIAQCPFQATYN